MDKVVLCGANAYQKNFYLNPAFDKLPAAVKDELKIMCVLYTEDIGGIIMLVFDEDKSLKFEITHEETDYLYDEIGSELKIKQLVTEKRELLEGLQAFYRIVVLGEAGAVEC